MTIARVLVDSVLPQLDRLLDYRIPAQLTGIEPGMRVTVPLRSANRLAQGFVIELVEQQEHPGPLSDVESLVSPVPVLRPEVWSLVRAVADRAAGLGERHPQARDPAPAGAGRKGLAGTRSLSLSAHPTAASRPVTASPATRASVLWRRRSPSGGVSRWLSLPGSSSCRRATWVGRWAVTLARAAAQAVAAGESAILVAPDYRDQAQLAAALAAFLPAESIVQLDARQPNPERYRGLLRALGEAPVAILGNRSVVYAPAARLGLIAIWNDGDPLLAEPLSPNVHPRDAALVRQEQQDCALLIAGQTRTTEVQRLVEVGWLEELRPAAHHQAARHPHRGDRRAGPSRRAGADPLGGLAGGDQGRRDRAGAGSGGSARLHARTPLRRVRRPRTLPALRRPVAVRARRRSGLLRLVRRRRDRLGLLQLPRHEAAALGRRRGSHRRRTGSSVSGSPSGRRRRRASAARDR